MLAIVKIAAVSAFLIVFGFLAGRAYDYEQAQHSLGDRVTQLEVHDCGLRQFDDYSVSFEGDDETRFRCAAVMRGEIVCSKEVSGGDPYYALCHRP